MDQTDQLGLLTLPRYAIVEDNTIVNLIVANEEFIAAHYPDAIKCDDAVGVGDKYEDGEFTRVVNIMTEDDSQTL